MSDEISKIEVKRSSNFELLRILLILFVIVLHYNDSSRHGAFSFIESTTTINRFFLYSVESLSLCAVNAFLCLSGFFLSRKNEVSISKIIHLFVILFSYRIFTYLLAAIPHHTFQLTGLLKCFIPSNYYANLYSVVFVLSPFLNLVTRNFDIKNYKRFLILLLSLFAVIPTLIDYILPTFFSLKLSTVSTISLYGNCRGFTLINFILLYYIGGGIARIDAKTKLKPLAVYLISSLFVLLMMCKNRSPAISYCNIFVVIQAASLVACFKMIKIQSSFVNVVAKSVWGVFCIHGFFLGIYCKFFPYDLSQNICSLVIHFFGCIVSVFIVSVLWDKICSIALTPLENLLKRIRFINKKISVKEDNP